MQPQEIHSNDLSFKDYFSPFTNTKAIIFLLVIGLIVYGNTLLNGFVWDDLLQANAYHALSNILPVFQDHTNTYYRPLSGVYFIIVNSIFGPAAFWFHLLQILLHVTISILLFFLFAKFLKRVLSFLLAVVFLIHPMNVESVAYVSAIENVLSLLFLLIALFVLTRKKLQPILQYGIGAIALLLSCLAKEYGIIAFVFILCFQLFNPDYQAKKKQYLYLGMVFGIVVLVYGYFRFFFGGYTPIVYPKAVVPIIHASFSQRLLTLPKILFYYLFTFIDPKDLAISQQWLVTKIDGQNFLFPLIVDSIFFGSLFVGTLWMVKAKKQGNAYIFFLIWFLLSWMVAWQFIPLDMTVADRWFYIPMVGLLGLVGLVLQAFWPVLKRWKSLIVSTTVVILVLFSVRTMVRNTNWSDQLTLLSHDEKISTESYDVENGLGDEYLLRNNAALAKIHIMKSIELAPTYWVNWYNLGLYYDGQSKTDDAIRAFTMSMKNAHNYFPAYFMLATDYYQHKNLSETKTYLTNALREFPHSAYLLFLSGVVDCKLHHDQQAQQEILQAYAKSNYSVLLQIYQRMKEQQPIDMLVQAVFQQIFAHQVLQMLYPD